jgi:hypothetical protein
MASTSRTGLTPLIGLGLRRITRLGTRLVVLDCEANRCEWNRPRASRTAVPCAVMDALNIESLQASSIGWPRTYRYTLLQEQWQAAIDTR